MKDEAQTIAERWQDTEGLERAMEEAVADALRTHKLLGFPIVIWRDGQVVWIPPEEIEIPGEQKNGTVHKPGGEQGPMP